MKTSKPNLDYTRGITSKRVTSGGAHLRDLAPGPGNTASKHHRTGGQPLATLCLIWPARESNPRPLAPIAMSLTTTLCAGAFVIELASIPTLTADCVSKELLSNQLLVSAEMGSL